MQRPCHRTVRCHVVTLETERLRLRMFRDDDLDSFAEMVADPEVMRYIAAGQTLPRTEAWRRIAMHLGHWQLRGYGMWAAEEKTTGQFIGIVGCFNPAGWSGFEVGWTLLRRHWGRGFATEGARAALRHAFTELGQPHVISLIQPPNARSIAVAERLGERLEGRTELLGVETLIYGIRCDEWDQFETKV